MIEVCRITFKRIYDTQSEETTNFLFYVLFMRSLQGLWAVLCEMLNST